MGTADTRCSSSLLFPNCFPDARGTRSSVESLVAVGNDRPLDYSRSTSLVERNPIDSNASVQSSARDDTDFWNAAVIQV